MKIKTLLISGAILSSTFCASAYAEGFYVGGGFGSLGIQVDDPEAKNGKAGVSAVNLTFGKQVNDYFGFEVRFGTGAGDDTLVFIGEDASIPEEDPVEVQYDVKIEIDKYYGAYFKFGAPASEKLYPYAMFGYSFVDINSTSMRDGANMTSTASEDGVAYAFGVDYNLTDSFAISLEYTNLINENDVGKISGFQVLGSYSF